MLQRRQSFTLAQRLSPVSTSHHHFPLPNHLHFIRQRMYTSRTGRRQNPNPSAHPTTLMLLRRRMQQRMQPSWIGILPCSPSRTCTSTPTLQPPYLLYSLITTLHVSPAPSPLNSSVNNTSVFRSTVARIVRLPTIGTTFIRPGILNPT